MPKKLLVLIVTTMTLCTTPSAAEDVELDMLSIEQLMGLEVTSVSRKREPLQEAAAAVHVVSAEDIRRAGATSIPEALRLVPGLHVAQIDANKWAITARGFNDRYANRLLVLMDGRHVYTPFFSGVFWDQHTVPMDNIERIEVIRGPGATLWGANAVNGVINIITRSPRETQGWLLQANAGTRDIGEVTARYGGSTDSGWHYRVDVHSAKADMTESMLADDDFDDWQQSRVGVRIDGSPLVGHELSLDMGLHQGDSRETLQVLDGAPLQLLIQADEIDTHGGWLSANWERRRENGNGWSVNAYVDHLQRDTLLYDLEQTTFSVDLQSRHLLGERNDLVWGAGARHAKLPFSAKTANFLELETDETYQLWEVFLQDEIEITDSLRLVIGAKMEKSEFSDLEVQPNVRFSWQVSEAISAWGAVSQAVRTPSKGESHLRILPSYLIPAFTPPVNLPTPSTLSIDGNEDVTSERMTSYELGARFRVSDRFHVDVAAYFNDYDDIIGASTYGTFCQPGNIDISVNPLCVLGASYIASATRIDNSLAAESHGFEVAVHWQPRSNWTLSGAYSYTAIDFAEAPTTLSVPGSGEPQYLAHIRSEWTVTENLEFDIMLRAVDDAERFNADSFVTADVRLGWRPTPAFSVEVIGKNLLDDGHIEFGTLLLESVPGQIKRSVAARFTWAP